MDVKSFTAGFLCGLVTPGRLGGRTPIAYSYNGVVLPKLPEWDRETYPYAYIGVYTNFAVLACFNSYSYDYGTDGDRRLYLNPPWSRYNLHPLTATTWEYIGVNENGAGNYVSKAVWANFDILNEDGSVYLAKSDPVPVYE